LQTKGAPRGAHRGGDNLSGGEAPHWGKSPKRKGGIVEPPSCGGSQPPWWGRGQNFGAPPLGYESPLKGEKFGAPHRRVVFPPQTKSLKGGARNDLKKKRHHEG